MNPRGGTKSCPASSTSWHVKGRVKNPAYNVCSRTSYKAKWSVSRSGGVHVLGSVRRCTFEHRVVSPQRQAPQGARTISPGSLSAMIQAGVPKRLVFAFAAVITVLTVLVLRHDPPRLITSAGRRDPALLPNLDDINNATLGVRNSCSISAFQPLSVQKPRAANSVTQVREGLRRGPTLEDRPQRRNSAPSRPKQPRHQVH